MTETTFAPTVLVQPTAADVAQQVAGVFAQAIRAKPSIVLGLATGGSPVGTYRELVRLHEQSGLDFSNVTTFNLDEYVGLGAEHPQSFRYFMRTHLFDHVNVDPSRTHVPPGVADDIAEAADRYERAIDRAGGIELQLLGIGSNGHIAFNEPGSPRDSQTREVSLTPETIAANARFFDSPDQVPRSAITMGIATILRAKRIVVIATGPAKRAAIGRAIASPPSLDCPASLLQYHRDVTFVIDHEAGHAESTSDGVRSGN